MKANEKAASAVEKLIKALPKSERVDYTDQGRRSKKPAQLYDELTDDQKKLVSNLDTLTAAEARSGRRSTMLRRINLRRKL